MSNEPTPRLAEFRKQLAEDDNAFWRLQSGDHQNLLEEALDQLDAVAKVADRIAPHAENMCRIGELEIGVPLRNAVRDIRAALAGES
jgi:hypothetical protein